MIVEKYKAEYASEVMETYNSLHRVEHLMPFNR